MPKYRDGRSGNRPPVKNQFKPGQSGNKKGRPSRKATTSVTDILGRLLQEKHPIMIHGRQKKVPYAEIVIMRILAQAGKGDARALAWVTGHMDNPEIMTAGHIKHQERRYTAAFAKEYENMTEHELDEELRRLMEEQTADFGPRR